MSRTESYREGRVPLHTLRADIDYGIPRGADLDRAHRREGLDLQGRHPALPGLTNDEKIVREAAMAVGDAVPVGATGIARRAQGRRARRSAAAAA